MFNEITEENTDKEILESLTNNIEFINKDLQSNKSQKSKASLVFQETVRSIVLQR